jgi:Protein of unknown function (DUF3574)
MLVEHLYFDTARPNGQVSPEDWRAFLAETVTPRFPEGLTVWDASGQWRGSTGQVVREASYVLNIVHPNSEASNRAVLEIANAYKGKFQQESVLRTVGPTCVSF